MGDENQMELLLAKMGQAPVVYVAFMEANLNRTVPTSQGGVQLARAVNLVRLCGRVTLLVSVEDDWIAEGAKAFLERVFRRFRLRHGLTVVQRSGPQEPGDPPLYVFDVRYAPPATSKKTKRS